MLLLRRTWSWLPSTVGLLDRVNYDPTTRSFATDQLPKIKVQCPYAGINGFKRKEKEARPLAISAHEAPAMLTGGKQAHT